MSQGLAEGSGCKPLSFGRQAEIQYESQGMDSSPIKLLIPTTGAVGYRRQNGGQPILRRHQLSTA